MNDPIVQGVGLGHVFGHGARSVRALYGVSVALHPGKTLGVIGESGSGKSTLGDILGGMLVPGEGEVFYKGRALPRLDRRQFKEFRRDVQFIFQDCAASLDPRYSVARAVAEPLDALPAGLDAKARERAVLEMLERVGLTVDIADRKTGELSGGQCQRVAIARALVGRPAVVVCDEPTSALDVSVQAQVLNLLRELQDDLGCSYLFISHDMGVVADIADRVLVMYRGEAVETGSVEEIFRSPQHPYTQSLLAAVPRLGEMRGQDLPRRFPLPGQSLAESETPDTVVAGEPILQVRDLVARFPVRGGLLNRVTREVHAVEKVSFDLWPGETLSLVGESGCGKSTTGRALLRLVETQGGTITFDGQRIDTLAGGKLQALRRNIQFIFQDPYASLDPRQTVGDSIMEPLRVHGLLRGEAARERVAWLLKRVGLQPEHAWRYPHAFSGGQRQRICIARALALNPKVVIADESVSALDVSIRAQIINLMLDLQREMGIAFLFISHDMAVVERISHRVAVMYRGRIVEIGPRRAVFENPQHPYTRKLMAAVPVADPGHRHPQRVLLSDDVPGNIYKRGEEIASVPLQQVGPGHFVARESADVLGRT